MQKKIKYHYNEHTQILYKTYIGNINIEDIISSWKNAISNNIIHTNVIGIICDYRLAHFDLGLDQDRMITEFYHKNLNVFGGLKIAILTSDPMDYIIPLLVKNEDKGYESSPFTNIENALSWVIDKPPSKKTCLLTL